MHPSGALIRNLHIRKPREYFRQYIGITRNGRKQIYVNAFCRDVPPPPSWRDRLVVADDGGACFWHAIYDLGTGRFLSLAINPST